MNDNFAPKAVGVRECHTLRTAQSVAIAEVRDVAARAVTKPETLTMGEIQEVGWAFLIASKELNRAAKHA